MSKFYIVYHAHKHGEDLVYCDSLDEAKTQAQKLTAEHYSDYAKTYKEVSTQGCYNNIYIKSIILKNDAIKKEDLQDLYIQMGVNPEKLPIEDNELDLTMYPNITHIMNKYGLKMEFGRFSYYSGYHFLDPKNNNCVLFTDQYLNQKDATIESKIAIRNVPHHTQRHFAIDEKNQYDNSVSMKELDEFCGIIKYIDFKVTRIVAKDQYYKDLYGKEFTILHE